jgi:hypothetical protein
MAGKSINLVRDTKGMYWDLLLYVPTVTALLSMAAKFWFGGDVNLAYLLLFLGSFFFIAGANRILKTRLMVLPSAPIALTVKNRDSVSLALRDGKELELVSGLKFYPDYAGKSFGLVGHDKAGQRAQFVFHKGQFPSEQDFQSVLKVFRD